MSHAASFILTNRNQEMDLWKKIKCLWWLSNLKKSYLGQSALVIIEFNWFNSNALVLAENFFYSLIACLAASSASSAVQGNVTVSCTVLKYL